MAAEDAADGRAGEAWPWVSALPEHHWTAADGLRASILQR